jgi:hypothetical protein
MSERKTGLVLSIQQPWAWLIVNGYKDVENRDWPTKLRGWIGIHAGKKFDAWGYDVAKRQHPEITFPAPDDFVRGGIVGRALLTDCVTASESPWFLGEYGFVLTRAEPLPFTPCRGMLGFFRPTLTAEAQS